MEKLKQEDEFIKKYIFHKKEELLQKNKKLIVRCLFFNKNEYVGHKDISIFEKTFNHKGKHYRIMFEDVMKFYQKGLFKNKLYLIYEVHNTEPLRIENKHVQPKFLSSEELNGIIETKIIKDVTNHGSKLDLGDLIQEYKIFIIFGIIGIVVYFLFSSGGV